MREGVKEVKEVKKVKGPVSPALSHQGRGLGLRSLSPCGRGA